MAMTPDQWKEVRDQGESRFVREEEVRNWPSWSSGRVCHSHTATNVHLTLTALH